MRSLGVHSELPLVWWWFSLSGSGSSPWQRRWRRSPKTGLPSKPRFRGRELATAPSRWPRVEASLSPGHRGRERSCSSPVPATVARGSAVSTTGRVGASAGRGSAWRAAASRPVVAAVPSSARPTALSASSELRGTGRARRHGGPARALRSRCLHHHPVQRFQQLAAVGVSGVELRFRVDPEHRLRAIGWIARPYVSPPSPLPHQSPASRWASRTPTSPRRRCCQSAGTFRHLPAPSAGTAPSLSVAVIGGDPDHQQIEELITDPYTESTSRRQIGEVEYLHLGVSDLAPWQPGLCRRRKLGWTKVV